MATNFVLQAKQKPCAIFAIFTPYESVLGADDRSEFFVQYLKGHCHGNQFSGKMGQNYLPPALIALSFQKVMAIAISMCALTA